LTGRYQSADDNATTGAAATFALTTATNAASIAKHLRTEAFWDITQAGTISSGVAGGFVAQALTLYQGASWAGPLTVRYGSYTTMTGVPVDLGCEVAGEVVQLQLADELFERLQDLQRKPTGRQCLHGRNGLVDSNEGMGRCGVEQIQERRDRAVGFVVSRLSGRCLSA